MPDAVHSSRYDITGSGIPSFRLSGRPAVIIQRMKDELRSMKWDRDKGDTPAFYCPNLKPGTWNSEPGTGFLSGLPAES